MDPIVFDTPGHLQIAVTIPSGALRVETGAQGRAELMIERIKAPKDLEIRLDDLAGGGHRLSITYKGAKFGFHDRGVELTIRCPAGTDVDMSGGAADLSITGTVGTVDLRTGSGDLAFDEATGRVRVKVGSGDVVGRRVGGSVSMQGASGDVRLDAVAGDLVVKTASGDVSVGALDGDALITSISGDVELDSLREGRAQIRSVSGDVSVGVAAGADVLLDLRATSGDARSDLAMVEAPVGGGRQLELTVVTVSGDIAVRRAPAREPV